MLRPLLMTPHPYRVALERTRLLLGTRRWTDAAAAASRTVAVDPDRPEGWFCLAQAQLGLDDAPGALESARRGLAVRPDEEWGHRICSVALLELDRADEALLAAEEAVRIQPQWATPLIWLARVHLRARRHQDAWEAAERAVRLAPQKADAHFVLGLAAGRLGRKDVADEAHRRVLALDPTHALALNKTAERQVERGRIGAAARSLGAALAHDPQLLAARQNIDIVGLRWMRRLHLLAWLWFLPVLAAFRWEETASGDEVARPLKVATGAAAFLVLGWWNLRVRRDVPTALRRTLRIRLVRRRLLLLAVVIDATLLTLVAALAFAPHDVADAAAVPLLQAVVGLDVAYLMGRAWAEYQPPPAAGTP